MMKWIPFVAAAGLVLVPNVLAQSPSGQSQQPTAAQREKQKDQQKPVGTSGAGMTTVNAIVDNPATGNGKQVTVSGPIGDVFSQRVFNIEEGGPVDVDDELLVVLTSKTANSVQKLSEDARVQVQGTVRTFVRSELERDYGIADWGWYDVTPDFRVSYDRKPVLVASKIDVMARDWTDSPCASFRDHAEREARDP
jgi:hypothetical protein